jgi:MFS family permease
VKPSEGNTTPAPDAPPPGWTAGGRRFALVLLSLSAVLNLMDRQAITILIEPIKAEFHLSDTRIGLLTGSAFAFCYALCALPMARLLDRGPRKTIYAAALALWSLATMATGLATSYLLLLVSRLVVAFGESSATPAQQSLVADLYRGRGLPRAISALVVGSAVGAALALLIGGLVSAALGWRAALFVVGAPGVLLALVIHFALREPPRRTQGGDAPEAKAHSSARVFAHLWSLRSYRWILLANAGAGFSGYATMVWVPSLLIRVHHVPIGYAGFLLAGVSAAGVISTAVLSGQLSAFLGGRDPRWHLRLSGLALLAAIPPGLLLAYSPTVGLALLGLFLCHFGNSFYLAPSATVVQSLAPPQMRSTAAAAATLMQTLAGAGLGPLAVGLMNDALMATSGLEGIRTSIAVATAGLAVGGVAMFCANRFVLKEYADMESRPATV